MIIYLYGCSCGLNARMIRKVKVYGKQHDEAVEVRNSKYNSDMREEHAEFLKQAGISTAGYPSVVVDAASIVLLKKWKSS